MTAALHPHVEIGPDGVPIVAGTRTKVVEIVLDRLVNHWDADEIRRQHPHLSLAQIYSALAYYYDHQPEIDRDIQARLEKEEKVLGALGQSPNLSRLLAAKRGS